jgi:MFS family permease
VGTIGLGLIWSGSIVVNPLIARTKHVQLIMLAGVSIMSLGIFLASFSTKVRSSSVLYPVVRLWLTLGQLWHLYLTQGLLCGIGSSLYYFPVIILTPAYFDAHRGFALGLILSGSGIGGLILSPVLNALISKLGIGWALRILGIWNFVVGVPVSCVVKKRGNMYSQSRTIRIDLSVAKRGAFIWQVLSECLLLEDSEADTHDCLAGVWSISPSRWEHCAHIFFDDLLCLCVGILLKNRSSPPCY